MDHIQYRKIPHEHKFQAYHSRIELGRIFSMTSGKTNEKSCMIYDTKANLALKK